MGPLRCRDALGHGHAVKLQLVTGTDKRFILSRTNGLCAVFAVLHADRVDAPYAIRGRQYPAGVACCEACATALGVVKKPGPQGTPTLLPGVL